MAFRFPFTSLHEINLDWILEKVKALVESNDEFNEKADYAVQTADEAKTIAEQAAQATIADGSVTEQKIANNAVTVNKIANGSVTTTKISNGSVTYEKIADGAVNTAKITDDAVNFDKLASNAKLKRGGLSYTLPEPITVAAGLTTPGNITVPSDQFPDTAVIAMCSSVAGVLTLVKVNEVTNPSSYAVRFRNLASSEQTIATINLWYLYY